MNKKQINNTSSSKCLDDYLKNNRAEKGGSITHTRIPKKELNIFGGSFNMENNEEFLDYYYNKVFIDKEPEYLTEKQLTENGPLLVDIDLRFDKDIHERQYTKEHITDLISLYLSNISEIYNIPHNSEIGIYIYEKMEVNKLEDVTKDGIHIYFTINMSKPEQCVLRKKIINDIGEMWSDLNIVNSYEDVFDEGVTKGFVNWQLYGSKKPGNKPYNLTDYITASYDDEEETWNIKNNNVGKLNMRQHLSKMSARNPNHPRFEVKDNEYLLEAIENEKRALGTKDNKTHNGPKINILTNKIDLDLYDFSKIENQMQLDNLIEIFIDSIGHNDYELKETHLFAINLPKEYYEGGSYNNWIRVGWALKNTNEKMFLTWMKLSSKASIFDYRDIPQYYEMWCNFELKNGDGLTHRSIMYWLKTTDSEKYNEIRQETISYYIDQTIESITQRDKLGEFDLALVLYQLFKDKFVCASVKNNIWYEYFNNKWQEVDSGNTLRLHISKKMHDLYIKKANDTIEAITKLENNDQNADSFKVRSCKLGDICVLLKTTSWKNNIMKEAKELFYDKDFLDKLDSNPTLLCFNNYVVDFKNKVYRKGKPDDYISKSTNIDYIPYEKLNGTCYYDKSKKYEDIISDINKFIDELFPVLELKNYMWDHLASVLVGTNENQTFNIYTGSGCNGKSKLVELMSKVLGDYKATVPITLITQKRNTIGSTSSEVVNLQGVRYAVMQEPSKGDRINEGIMKEITGGDPIQGRALYRDTVTFFPQFKLVVCTNVLFDIPTNDDGTWRRIRICDFMSKFNDAPYENEDKFPKSNFPYQYEIDRKIDEKFELWAPVLASILVSKAFENNGYVKDVKIVMAGSDKYREGQDYLTEFAREKVVRRRDAKIKKVEILEEFKNWFIMNYGRNNLPNGKEITDYMDNHYGKCNRGKWFNVAINYDDSDDEDDDNETNRNN